MERNVYKFFYMSPDPMSHPSKDAKNVYRSVIAPQNRGSEEVLRIELSEYYSKNIFFDRIFEELKCLMADKKVRDELIGMNLKSVEICCNNPKEISEIVWYGTRGRPIN